MKRTRSRAKKKEQAKRPLQFPKSQHRTGRPSPAPEEQPRLKYSPQIGLPPNEKLRKFADEIYGAIQLPPGRHGK